MTIQGSFLEWCYSLLAHCGATQQTSEQNSDGKVRDQSQNQSKNSSAGQVEIKMKPCPKYSEKNILSKTLKQLCSTMYLSKVISTFSWP